MIASSYLLHKRHPSATVPWSCTLQPYLLDLKFPFGTSHSTTTSRNNALFSIKIGGITSYGEAGLPPKRKHVYCADLDDILTFVTSWERKVCTLLQNLSNPLPDPLQDVPLQMALPLRQALQSAGDNPWYTVVTCMLIAVHHCDVSLQGLSSATAGQAMVEIAVLSAVALQLGIPNYELLSVPSASLTATPTFYTASLNDDINVTLASTKFGQSFTPNIKIKLNNDLDQNRRILSSLNEWCQQQDVAQDTQIQWCVDANCAWTPSSAMDMLDILLPYQSCIVMIEQPFPVELMLHETSSTTQEREEWSQVKQAYNKAGFLIFADESMRTAQDLSKLVHVVNGVNIKMEKCGGYLNALQIIQLAQELQLDLWVGCMVGSMLNMNGAAALVGTKGIIGSDLDGSALVTEECQTWLTGGFTFHKGTIAMSTLAGMGLTMKNTFMVPRLQRWEVNWSSGRYSVPGQGFHQETVHPLLEKFSTPHLNLAPTDKVLVPLCGKSVDMLYFAQQGLSVTGLEAIPRAIHEFGTIVHGHSLVAEKVVVHGNATQHRWNMEETGDVCIVEGDAIEFKTGDQGPMDAIWDRGAVVALRPEDRCAYVAMCANAIKSGGRVLLCVVEHDLLKPSMDEDQNSTTTAAPYGPPYSFTADDVVALYQQGPFHLIEELSRTELIDEEPRWKSKGATFFNEVCYLLEKGDGNG